MNFCPNCGSKNEFGGLFCTSCGSKLAQEENNIKKTVIEHKAQHTSSDSSSSNSIPHQRFTIPEFAQNIRNQYPKEYDDLSDSQLVNLWVKKYPNDQDKIIFSAFSPSIEKKTNNRWYWIGGILIFIAAVSSYFLYKDSLYPKTETELSNLLCDKFWKITSVDIEEIYYDGKLVPQPTSDVRKNLTRSLNGDNSEQAYNIIKESIERQKEKDSYISYTLKKNTTNGRFWKYDQSFDKDLQDYTFSTLYFSFIKQNGRFTYSYNYNPTTFRLSNNDIVPSEIDASSVNETIEEIATDKLVMKEDGTFILDGLKIRVIIKTTYKDYMPQNTLRYNQERSLDPSMDDFHADDSAVDTIRNF